MLVTMAAQYINFTKAWQITIVIVILVDLRIIACIVCNIVLVPLTL